MSASRSRKMPSRGRTGDRQVAAAAAEPADQVVVVTHQRVRVAQARDHHPQERRQPARDHLAAGELARFLPRLEQARLADTGRPDHDRARALRAVATHGQRSLQRRQRLLARHQRPAADAGQHGLGRLGAEADPGRPRQRLDDRRRAGVALLRRQCAQPRQDGVEPLRHIRARARQRRRRPRLGRQFARQHMVKSHADGVEVHRRRRRRARQRLGREVDEAARRVAVRDLLLGARDPEVHDLRLAPDAHQDVVRLQVAVDDAAVVQIRAGTQHLHHPLQHALEGGAAAGQVQILADHPRLGEPRAPVGQRAVLQHRRDLRMPQPRPQLELAPQPVAALPRVQHLEHHRAAAIAAPMPPAVAHDEHARLPGPREHLQHLEAPRQHLARHELGRLRPLAVSVTAGLGRLHRAGDAL
jgi:hypothetical protein